MLDCLRTILSIIFAVSMMYFLLDCKLKYNRNFYLFWLYISVVVIGDSLILLTLGYTVFMELFPIIVQLPSYLAFVYLSRFNFIKVFFVHLTFVAITISITMFSVIISSIFNFSMETMDVMCYIMYLPIWLLIYRYLRPSFLYMLRNADKGWIGFCAIPLSYTLLVYLIIKTSINKSPISTRSVIILALLLILTFSAYVLIFRFFRQTREQLSLQNEQNLLKIQVEASKLHFEELRASQEKTLIYRHDMRHHLNLIGSYLADNNSAAALEYISEVEKTIRSAVVEQYCNNYTVNLILYSYIARAKDAGIKVETQIDLREKNTVADMDLCVIFANAIENAVNACKLVSNSKSRTIKIFCAPKNDKLFIQITNHFEGTVLFQGDMPVSIKENHGLGTKSIVAVAQAYGGIYSFSAEAGVFTTSVIL